MFGHLKSLFSNYWDQDSDSKRKKEKKNNKYMETKKEMVIYINDI